MVITRHKGFTLLEVMVVVAIAAILATIGLPAMQNGVQNQRVRTAASDTHVSLLLTRSEAIKRSKNVNMATTSSWESGWNVVVPADSITVRTQDAFPNLVFECNTDSDAAAESCPSTVTFTRVGRPSFTSPQTTMEFRIFVSGNTDIIMRCVSISLSGVPKVKIDSDQDQTNGC